MVTAERARAVASNRRAARPRGLKPAARPSNRPAAGGRTSVPRRPPTATNAVRARSGRPIRGRYGQVSVPRRALRTVPEALQGRFGWTREEPHDGLDVKRVGEHVEEVDR